MKEIKAYIRDNMVNNVIDALTALPGAPAVAVVPLRTYGHGVTPGTFAGVHMTKIEVDVADHRATEVAAIIRRHARTGDGHPGDGRILITNVEGAIRIADGEQGPHILEG